MSKPQLNALPPFLSMSHCNTTHRCAVPWRTLKVDAYVLVSFPCAFHARACNIIIHSCVVIDGMVDIFIKCDPFPNYHPLCDCFRVDLGYQVPTSFVPYHKLQCSKLDELRFTVRHTDVTDKPFSHFIISPSKW